MRQVLKHPVLPDEVLEMNWNGGENIDLRTLKDL